MAAACARSTITLALLASTALASGCTRPASTSDPVTIAGPSAPAAATAASTADPHDAHRAYATRTGPEAAVGACSTCHGAHPLYRIDPNLVLAGGTSTAGAQLVRDASGTTCTVACHFPFGAPARPVAWSGGPLRCRGCHSTVNRRGADRRSSHDPIFSDAFPGAEIAAPAVAPDATGCTSCHAGDAASHLTGDPRLASDATADAACTACHAGAGQTLRTAAGPDYVEETPPVLPGWTDAAAGDFHGARAGTGYGGTLRAPFARGQGPLPCRSCHAGHESGNAFLVAPVVNGVAIPPGTIDRAGVGAEALCEACHEGERHGQCMGCHTAEKYPDGGFMPGPAVDPMPAGSPCFWCHGHEGILKWTAPGSDMNGPWGQDCVHCHSFRGSPPPTDSVPPRILADRLSSTSSTGETPAPQVMLFATGTVLDLTPTSATIYWETDENATTWVAYGEGTAGWVVGNADTSCASPCPGRFHRVTLSGLRPDTTYVYRLRSADDFRNATVSPLATFRTARADAPLAPVPVHQPGAMSPFEVPYVDVVLTWSTVTAPDGHAIQYRAVVATTPDLAAPIGDSGWIDAASFPVTVPSARDLVLPYYWRVTARDAVEGTESSPSTIDTFGVWMYDPYAG